MDEKTTPEMAKPTGEELLDRVTADDLMKSVKGPTLSDLKNDLPEVKDEEAAQSEDEEVTPTGGKKMRIPSSRWKTLNARLDAAEREAREAKELRERLALLEKEVRSRPKTDELPGWWKNDYGDDENSHKAYATFRAGLREELRQAEEEKRERDQRETAEREARIRATEQSFDEQMDSLEEELGKTLSDREKSELLDIVAEYSPKDGDSYDAFIPLAKAYELSQKLAKKDPAKERIAQIAGVTSGGNAATSTQSTRPPQWGDWRKRFGG